MEKGDIEKMGEGVSGGGREGGREGGNDCQCDIGTTDIPCNNPSFCVVTHHNQEL